MLDEIKTEIKKFEELQVEYREFGAGDTEPDSVFQHCLMRALTGASNKTIPTSAAEWELFKHTGVGAAMKRIVSKTRVICNMILKTTLAEQREVAEYLTDYCWRVRD